MRSSLSILFLILAALASAAATPNTASWQASVTLLDNGNSLTATIYYQYPTNFSVQYAVGLTETENYPTNLPGGLKWEGCLTYCAAFPYAIDMAKMHVTSESDYSSLGGDDYKIIQDDTTWDITINYDTLTTPWTPKTITWKGGPQSYDRVVTVNSITWGEDGADPVAWESSNPFQLSPVCAEQDIQCYSVVDLVLLIDESDSITPADWQIAQEFAVVLINTFPVISPDAVMISVVTFDNIARTRIPLTGNRDQLISGVMGMIQGRGETNTAAGLDLSREILQASRPTVPDILIIMTDGEPNLPQPDVYPATIAAATATRDANITIYAIGIGEVEVSTLNLIVGPGQSSRTLSISDFSALFAEINLIVSSVCSTSDVPKCTDGCAGGSMCECGQCFCLSDCDAVFADITPETCYAPFCDGVTGTCNSGLIEGCCTASNATCNGHGHIVGYGLVNSTCDCSCTSPWTGPTCQTCPIPPSCSGHGTFNS